MPLPWAAHPPLRAALAAALACTCLAGCRKPGDEIDTKDLERAGRDIASLAAEDKMLSEEVRAGNVTDAYARVHRDALLEDAGKLADALRRPAPPALRASQEQAESRLQAVTRSLERGP